jgi:putative transposase
MSRIFARIFTPIITFIRTKDFIMHSLFTPILKLFLYFFFSKRALIARIMLLEKEREILLRHYRLENKRIPIRHLDRIFLSILNSAHSIRDHLSIIKPETLLARQRVLLESFWTYPPHSRGGRPPVSQEIKELVLRMKNENLSWGYVRISGELKKLGVDLDSTTIANILRDFRRKGKARTSLTWKRFLKSHIDSLFATDFFTIDTIFNQRFYIFFIISHGTREIVQFAITRNPVKEFVKQQMILFEEKIMRPVYLIHDRSGEFFQDYPSFNIKEVISSVKAPNMNAFAERFVGSIRREAFDNFIIFNEQQIRKILIEYIDYYNSLRPHQGIECRIPQGTLPPDDPLLPLKCSSIRSKPILGGLHHHYFRKAA